MRKLKFNAWNITKQKMITPYLTFDKQGKPVIRLTELNDRLIPLQYSAYKDRDGKEIFEGHILKEYWEGGYTLNEVVFIESVTSETEDPGWQVDFICAYDTSLADVDQPLDISEGGRFSRMLPLDWIAAEAEIVGHKYENPELLQDMRRDHFYR